MELHVKGKIIEPRFLFFNNRGPLRGFLKLPLSMVCQHTCPVCLVWAWAYGHFFARGGGEPFAQKFLTSCPNFYETVERKRCTNNGLHMK